MHLTWKVEGFNKLLDYESCFLGFLCKNLNCSQLTKQSNYFNIRLSDKLTRVCYLKFSTKPGSDLINLTLNCPGKFPPEVKIFFRVVGLEYHELELHGKHSDDKKAAFLATISKKEFETRKLIDDAGCLELFCFIYGLNCLQEEFSLNTLPN